MHLLSLVEEDDPIGEGLGFYVIASVNIGYSLGLGKCFLICAAVDKGFCFLFGWKTFIGGSGKSVYLFLTFCPGLIDAGGSPCFHCIEFFCHRFASFLLCW